MSELPLITFFLIGFFSTFHCVGMCGGIMGALGFSTPEAVRSNRLRFFGFILSYNIGRISSYTLAGLLVGALGALVADSIHLSDGHFLLRLFGALIMLGTGLYLAGWFPDFKRLEGLGRPLWRRLEPFARRLLPVKNTFMAGVYGAVWGWLPCGLVYSTLLYAASEVEPVHSAMAMLAFGVGTLPVMLATGLMIQPITKLARSGNFRRVAGILVCISALASLLFMPEDHNNHIHSTESVSSVEQ